MKIFVRGDLPERFSKKHKPPGFGEVEIYRDGRFFTVTGQRQPGTPDDVKERPAELMAVYEMCVGWNQRATPAASRAHTTANITPSRDRDTAMQALSVLDPGCHYEEWTKIGMAVRAVDSGLFGEWDRWSRGSDKYHEGEFASKWESFTSDGVSIGTLCHLADATGKTWRPYKDRPIDYAEVAEEMKPRRLSFRRAEELIQQFGRLRESIIDGRLRAGETMNVIAAPKVGKSWLTLSLALCVATGRKWLDQFITVQRDVLLIDNELHEETLADRLPRVAMALGFAPCKYENRLFVDSLRGNLADLHSLCSELRKCEPGRFGLIVVDAFYRTLPGGIDENSNADVAAFYNALDATAKQIDCAFVLVHHTSKGDQSGKSVTDIGAGAGSQSRATDTHLVLRQHKVDNVASVAASVRSWPPLDPFCIQWEYPAWRPADQFDPADLRTARTSTSPPSSGLLDRDREKVLNAYRQFPSGETPKKIRESTGISGTNFGPIQLALESEGLLESVAVIKSGRSFSGYRLPIGTTGTNPDQSLSL